MDEPRAGLERLLTDGWTLAGLGFGTLALLTEVLQKPSSNPHLEFWMVLPGWPAFVMLLVGFANPAFFIPALVAGVLATGVLYGTLGFVLRRAGRLVRGLVRARMNRVEP